MAYIVGALAGGSALGGAAAAVGALAHGVVPWSQSAAFVVGLLVVAAAGLGDVVRRGRALPWPQRQVNEDWLTTYRGWIYGIGFGFQLGLGVVTYITTFGVLATIAVAFLTASPPAGVLIGAGFGVTRGLALLTVRRVQDPASLRTFHRWMADSAPSMRRWTGIAQLAIVVGGAGVAIVAGGVVA